MSLQNTVSRYENNLRLVERLVVTRDFSLKSATEVRSKLHAENTSLIQERLNYKTYFESSQVVRSLIESTSSSHIESLQSLATFALGTIFPDRAYSLSVEVTEKRGSNTANFYLVEERTNGDLVKSSLHNEVGGSIRAVMGFIFQIYYLRKFDMFPVIYLDESFTSLSDDYLPNLIDLLHQLSEKLGFIFVWISHDDRVSSAADCLYSINDGEATVQVK